MKEFAETEQKKLTLPWSRPPRQVFIVMRHEANTLTSHRLEHSFNDKRIEGERIGYRPSALR